MMTIVVEECNGRKMRHFCDKFDAFVVEDQFLEVLDIEIQIEAK